MKEIKESDIINKTSQSATIDLNVESCVVLSNEKIASVFYEIVRNRLQHINSWSIIAPGLQTHFQLINKSKIEVYRKAQLGDFVRVERLDKDGRVIGRFKPTGVRPRFAERLKLYGLQLPRSFFEEVA